MGIGGQGLRAGDREAVRTTYHLGVGELVVDLSGLDFGTGGAAVKATPASASCR